jgi:hypothetical protein
MESAPLKRYPFRPLVGGISNCRDTEISFNSRFESLSETLSRPLITTECKLIIKTLYKIILSPVLMIKIKKRNSVVARLQRLIANHETL